MTIKNKIKSKDLVIVTAGSEKGKKGQVIRVFPKEQKVLISGVNIVTKHVKNSGIQKKEAPIHISNVACVDKATGGPTKVGYKVLEDGTKVRISRKTKEIIG